MLWRKNGQLLKGGDGKIIRCGSCPCPTVPTTVTICSLVLPLILNVAIDIVGYPTFEATVEFIEINMSGHAVYGTIPGGSVFLTCTLPNGIILDDLKFAIGCSGPDIVFLQAAGLHTIINGTEAFAFTSSTDQMSVLSSNPVLAEGGLVFFGGYGCAGSFVGFNITLVLSGAPV